MSENREDNLKAAKERYDRYRCSFNDGDVIFREGEQGQEMFIIQAGDVLISKQVHLNQKPLATLRQGDFFGEMAILNNQPRSATATAKTAVQCLVFDRDAFETMLQTHAQIGIKMIKKLSNRLRQADTMIENLLLKDDYTKVTNSIVLKSKTAEDPHKRFKLADVAIHAGVREDVAGRYFAKLASLEIVNLNEEDSTVQIVDGGRLERLRHYLAMREEFMALEKPAELDMDKARVSFF